MSSTSRSSSSSSPPRLPFVLLSLLGFFLGYCCRLGFSILVTVLDAGLTHWKQSRNKEMINSNLLQEQPRPPQEDQSDSFSQQGLSWSSSSNWSLRSLPSSSDYSDLDLVQIAAEEGESSTSMISSPTSSPQQQRSGSGLRRKRWNSAEETTSNDEQVGDHLLHLPSSSTNIPATTSTIPATPTSRCRSTSTDSTLFRRRTFAFQPNDVPYPRYVDSFQPSYVDSTPSPSPTTSQNLSLPSISPSSPALPQSRSQTQAHSRRRRALSDSHLFPSTRRSSSTTTSLHARAHPATYLAYWLDLADSASLFDSSNDSQEENVSDEEEGSFDDDGDDDDMESHVRREGLMNSDSDEDDVEMYQDSIPDNVSLPSTTSSFHLSTLFEDSDSDEDDENSPLHIEHYAPSPTPPLSLNSSSSSSPTSSTTSIPTTNTDHQGRVSLLPPFTQDQFLSFLADRSQASRSSSRTCTGVYPVHPDDDSSSSEDDSDSDDDMEVNGILVRNVAERTVQSRDPWREMDIRRRGGGEESQALNGAGGGNETAGFESGNSLGLEMWLSDGMPVSPEFESWRRARDESRESSGFSGHEFVEEEDEDEDDVEMESFISPPSSPRSSFSPLPTNTPSNPVHRPRQRYKKVLVDLGLRATPHLSSPFSEILAEKWRLCEEGQPARKLCGSPLRHEIVY